MSIALPPAPGSGSPLGIVWRGIRSQGIYLLLAVVWILSWTIILLDGGSVSLKSLLVPVVGLGIVAIGQTPVIICGSIDLSVAWLITVAAMTAAAVTDGSSGRLPLAIAATIGVGLIVGLLNGLVVTKVHVHGFVATLGMALALDGVVALQFAENASAAMPGSIVDSLGFGEIGPLPYSALLFIAVAVIVWWVLARTRLGHGIYAVGGGNDVARLSGIRSDRAVIAAHTISGVCAAIAGFYLAARLGTPNVEVGTNGVYDLESIAVVVLGGAALSGGRGRVGTTFAAALVFVLLDATFSQLEVNQFLKLVVRGIVIIAAVASYTARSGEEAK